MRGNRGLSFVLLFGALTLGGVAILMNRTVDTQFTQPFTHGLVVISAAIMKFVGLRVVAQGVVLSFENGPGAVLVSNGCNALEVCILFAAAVLAFPAPLTARVAGVVAGVAGLQALNLIRIMTLLVLARYARGAFDFFHLYVWDAFILLDGIVLFLTWNRWQTRRWPLVDSEGLDGAAP